MYELIKTLPCWLQYSLLIVPIISLAIAAGAFTVNVYQTILTNKLRRAQIVSDCLHTFMNDAMMHEAFYKIEYDNFIYDESFHDSDDEKKVDKLLRHFSNLALLWQGKLLNIDDIHPVQYFILRIMNNCDIEKYLSFIDEWASKSDTGAHPYSSLMVLKKALNNEK